MVNKPLCAHCGVEISRLVFCKPSHKVLYHREGKTSSGTENQNGTPTESTKLVKRVESVKPIRVDGPEYVPQLINQNERYQKKIESLGGLCEHGSAKELCRFSKCRGT